MTGIFLAINDAKDKKKLMEKGLAFIEFDLNGQKGIILDEQGTLDAVSLLGLETGQLTDTDYEGLHMFPFSRPGRDSGLNKVVVEDWSGDGETRRYKKITEEILLPIIKTSITISVPHARWVKPVQDGIFHIWIWSTPERGLSTKEKPPEEIWGHKVNCRDEAYPPSEKGIAIMDGDYAVAELVGNNLYIHHDLCHHGTRQELEIYKRLLEEVVIELTLSDEKKVARKKEIEEQRLKANREQYIKHCSARIKKKVERLQTFVEDGKKEIQRLQTKLIEQMRLLEENEFMGKHLDEFQKRETEKLGYEFDKLISLDKVLDVKVGRGIIEVFTDTLFCKDPRTRKLHEIGKFRIVIKIDGGEDCLRWLNLTRRVDGYKCDMHAPHVFPDGHACLGNFAEVIPEAIANYEFSILAMLAIQFVESVNVKDEAGCYIKNWPVAKSQPAKGR